MTSIEARKRFQDAMARFNNNTVVSQGPHPSRKSVTITKGNVVSWPAVKVNVQSRSANKGIYNEEDDCPLGTMWSSHNNKKVTKQNHSSFHDSITSHTDFLSESSSHTQYNEEENSEEEDHTTFSTFLDISEHTIKETNRPYDNDNDNDTATTSMAPTNNSTVKKSSWTTIRSKLASIPRPDDFLGGSNPDYAAHYRNQRGSIKKIDLYK